MTDASLPAGRFTPGDFRVRQVFSQTWSVLSRNFLTFVLVCALASLPDAVLGILMPEPTPDPLQNLGILGVMVVDLLLFVLLATLVQAVLLDATFQVMRGRRIDLAESARIGLRHFLPLVSIAIIVPVLAGLGFLLLVFPGFVLYTMWFVATPACVVEQLGPVHSMERSRMLTKGHRWKIFWMLILLALAFTAVQGVDTVAHNLSSGTPGATVAQIVNLILEAVWTAVYAILSVVTYHDLRVAKEGIDTDEIAAVFE
jgi:hypothetical protein